MRMQQIDIERLVDDAFDKAGKKAQFRHQTKMWKRSTICPGEDIWDSSRARVLNFSFPLWSIRLFTYGNSQKLGHRLEDFAHYLAPVREIRHSKIRHERSGVQKCIRR